MTNTIRMIWYQLILVDTTGNGEMHEIMACRSTNIDTFPVVNLADHVSCLAGR